LSVRIVELLDEREPLTDDALRLIEASFPREERQPVDKIRMEIQEKRLGLLTFYDFHLRAAVDDDGALMGVISGVYLESVNAGMVGYLAAKEEYRGQGVGRELREGLIEAMRANARTSEWDDMAYLLGEIEEENDWLDRLVRSGAAIPFDLDYVQPRMRPADEPVPLVLYRQPIADRRVEIPVDEVRRLLFAIYRRGYRVAYPLQVAAFLSMLASLEGRETVGVHRRWREAAANG
jgi:GNAT superfamily N-acetyltransferase